MSETLVHTGTAIGWYRCDGMNCPLCSVGAGATTRQLKESLRVAAQWAEWQEQSLEDFHAYGQMFGCAPGGNVFDFALADALKQRGMTWDQFHRKGRAARKGEG